MRIARCLLLAVLTALLSTGIAIAQENAEITGVVSDSTGAVVAGASVTVTAGETGAKRTTVTNSNGLYDFPGLAIGQYTLTISAPGFEAYSQTGIVVNVAQTLRVNATLSVGGSN